MELTLNTMITNGRTICNINSEGSNEVKFGVSERVLKGVNVGDKVLVLKQGITYEAEIISVSKQINSSTGQFDVRALIKSENNLASGIRVKCTFVYDKKDNIKYLDRNIVYYEGKEPFVYTVKDGEVIEKKFIKTGIENDDNVEVISGVDDNTRIISTWSSDLAEGSLVKINIEESGKKSVKETTVEEKEVFKNGLKATISEIKTNEKDFEVGNKEEITYKKASDSDISIAERKMGE